MRYRRSISSLCLSLVLISGNALAIGTTDDMAAGTRLPVTTAVNNLVNNYLQAIWQHDEVAVLATLHPESGKCLEKNQQAIVLMVHSQFKHHGEDQYQKKYRIVKFSKLADDFVNEPYDFIDDTDVELVNVVQPTHQVLFNENAFVATTDGSEKSLSQLNLVKIGVEKFYIEMPCIKDDSHNAGLGTVRVLDPEDDELKMLVASLLSHQLEDFSELLKAGNDSDARVLITIYLKISKENNKEKIERILTLIKDVLSIPINEL